MDFQLARPRIFEVLSVGPGRTTKKGVLVSSPIKPGDRVLVSCEFDGPVETRCGSVIINLSSILAWWEGPFGVKNSGVGTG